MAGQQQQIIDTIFSMKRKLLRREDSDDDSSSPFGPQKQDLRRKAQYARASDPDFLSEPRLYKKHIEHAGYRRAILQRNPQRYDPDGDIVEAGDEYEDEDDLEPVEQNPYAGIRIDSLLAPLTSAADLPTHPALSLAYTSNHLANLAHEAGALSRKEGTTIARAKNLYVQLQGDSSFAPAALAAMTNAPLDDSWLHDNSHVSSNGQVGRHRASEPQDASNAVQEVDMEDAQRSNESVQKESTKGDTSVAVVNGVENGTNGINYGTEAPQIQENGEVAPSPRAEDLSDTASQQTAHRMTTRARAQAVSTPSPPSSPLNGNNAVHPLFAFSIDSLPDRDMGLPAAEAEDTRMLLVAYVQKQEEVARATSNLYHGLLQADRMRQDVFKWSKAEGHVGEMSDGEDWYDNEEWGLEHDLIKGRDEEEDDTAVAGKKSTRQRRKPDKDER